MKSNGLAKELNLKLLFLSMGEVGGILGVGVKSVAMKRNSPCAGNLLEHN